MDRRCSAHSGKRSRRRSLKSRQLRTPCRNTRPPTTSSPMPARPGFDDSSWPVIEATGLAARRGGGKVSFIWYRAMLTIPAKIGNFETADAKAVLTAYVDDYAEVWINGQMPRRS